MFFIFGFGHQTAKEFGETPEQYCGRCHNQSPRRLTKLTSWFTLFFIPLIPYSSKYLLVCPVCGAAQELSRDEFEEILRNVSPNPYEFRRDGESRGSGGEFQRGGGSGSGQRGERGLGFGEGPKKPGLFSDTAKYAGKTPTQIAYLKKIEAHERRMAEQREAENADGDTGGSDGDSGERQ